METKNDIIQGKIPHLVKVHAVLTQIKPKIKTVIKRFNYKLMNAPDLNVTYANLGIRTIATLIDLAIIWSTFLILEMVLFHFNYGVKEFNSYRFFIGLFIWIFYHGLFESSVYQATIGKMLLKLKIIDLFGKRMSFIRATFRCILTIISILPVGIGIWYITTDPKKRSWHDLISGSYVIKI